MPEDVAMDIPNNAWGSLARNDMDCGHCIAELVDNAVAAQPDSFKIQIHFEQHPDDESLRVLHILDYSGGMTFETLKAGILLGGSVGENTLNEHGYGMKNALCTLTDKNNLNWELWTRHGDELSYVHGPFRNPMNILSTADGDELEMPALDFAHWGEEFSTYIKVEVKSKFINTLKGRGKNATNTNILKFYLMEDLAIKYRYFLREGEGNPNGKILISHLGHRHFLKPLELPAACATKRFDVVIMDSENTEHEIEVVYNWGPLNETRRETALTYYDENAVITTRKPVKNYQGNQPSQGFDVIIGNRTILTRCFEDIWETGVDDDGEKEYMVRHPSHNDYLGEMRIATFPEKAFRTVNNKRGIDPDDENWQKVLDVFRDIAECKPTPGGEANKSEKYYQTKLKEALDGFVPEGSTVSKEKSVWPTGNKIDMYLKVGDTVRIYELKVKDADALAVFQTKMYWDGLADQGADEVPTEAWLTAPGFVPSLQELVDSVNQLSDKHGNNYNIILKPITEVGIAYP